MCILSPPSDRRLPEVRGWFSLDQRLGRGATRQCIPIRLGSFLVAEIGVPPKDKGTKHRSDNVWKAWRPHASSWDGKHVPPLQSKIDLITSITIDYTVSPKMELGGQSCPTVLLLAQVLGPAQSGRSRHFPSCWMPSCPNPPPPPGAFWNMILGGWE